MKCPTCKTEEVYQFRTASSPQQAEHWSMECANGHIIIRTPVEYIESVDAGNPECDYRDYSKEELDAMGQSF